MVDPVSILTVAGTLVSLQLGSLNRLRESLSDIRDGPRELRDLALDLQVLADVLTRLQDVDLLRYPSLGAVMQEAGATIAEAESVINKLQSPQAGSRKTALKAVRMQLSSEKIARLAARTRRLKDSLLLVLQAEVLHRAATASTWDGDAETEGERSGPSSSSNILERLKSPEAGESSSVKLRFDLSDEQRDTIVRRVHASPEPRINHFPSTGTTTPQPPLNAQAISDTVEQLQRTARDLEAGVDPQGTQQGSAAGAAGAEPPVRPGHDRTDAASTSSRAAKPEISLWRCVCWHIYILVAIGLVASLAAALIWGKVSDNWSDGFAVALYILGFFTLVVLVLLAKHNEVCVTRTLGLED